MKFSFNVWTIGRLIELISQQKINLKPSYQRNFIWGKKDQTLLIESIKKGYPLPSFFIYQNADGDFEMVDGQQRSKTIFQYYVSEMGGNNKKVSVIRDQAFWDYPLNITIIYDLGYNDSLEQFYTLVNKYGYHLTPNELNKAQYNNSIFLNLVEKIVDSQEIKELDIFSESNKKRMSDRALIEEVVASIEHGIFEKRKAVTSMYKENELTQEKAEDLYIEVIQILNIILELNKIKSLNQTRYRQRNDFFTLFQFIYQNQDQSYSVFKYQYSILLLIEKHIRPTQEECQPFKDYALNCVSQTNSKQARDGRINFFNMILKNSEPNGSDQLRLILEYLEDFYGIDDETSLIPVDTYFLIDVERFLK